MKLVDIVVDRKYCMEMAELGLKNSGWLFYWVKGPGNPIEKFRYNWDYIQKDFLTMWDENPWVWVVKFKVVNGGEQ